MKREEKTPFERERAISADHDSFAFCSSACWCSLSVDPSGGAVAMRSVIPSTVTDKKKNHIQHHGKIRSGDDHREPSLPVVWSCSLRSVCDADEEW